MYLIPVLRHGIVVFAACQLVPLVLIGHAVAVGVQSHHHHSRLRRAALQLLVGRYVAVEGVALDVEVLFARHIDDRMVEAESDIAAPCTEGYHHIVHKVVLSLLPHRLLRVARFVDGHGVDKLSWGGTVFIHLGCVGRVLRLLVQHHDGEGMSVAPHAVVEGEGDVVCAFFFSQKDVSALC